MTRVVGLHRDRAAEATAKPHPSPGRTACLVIAARFGRFRSRWRGQTRTATTAATAIT